MSSDLFTVYQIAICGFLIVAPMSAAWREKHDAEAREIRRLLDAAKRDADLLDKELRAELDISAPHWSRDLSNGANLTAHLLIGRRRPEYGAALALRILAFLGYAPAEEDSRSARLREARARVRVPRKADLTCREDDSSAA